jgi:signal transduction histidine kinase/DNA-binding response OmpR family regulator
VTTRGSQSAGSTPPHILVVDDETNFVDLAKFWLEQAGYRVTVAYSGEEALQLLGCDDGATAPKEPEFQEPAHPFDLVLLDLSMPGMSGTAVCRSIRACSTTAQLPVLVLTALSSPQCRIQALEAGANDYLNKVFDNVELLARVGNLVRWYRAEKEGRAEVRRHSREMDALYDRLRRHSGKLAGLNLVMGLMLSELDLDSVLSVIVDGLVEHWNAALARVWLLEPDVNPNALLLRASAGLSTRLDGTRSHIPLNGACKIARLASQRQESLKVDLENDPEIVDQDWVRRHGLRSFVSFPLISKDRLTGILALFSPEELHQSDFELLRTFAHQATAAIENARSYAREQERVAELTALTRELERSQVRLVQSEKMAAAGRLAASLAHEINNPLQAIHNCLTLAQRFPLEVEEHTDFLALAGQEVERLINLVRRILDFCRPSRGHSVSANVNDLIEHVIALSQKKLQHSEVGLHLDLDPDLPSIRIVTDQISQVILNLIVNAIEALPDGGHLELSSQQTGDWIEIKVKDDGPGLTPSQIEYLFEPFFTTKPAGTGLGLAISFGIIERHGGTIQVESANGAGATFTVRLPIVSADERLI